MNTDKKLYAAIAVLGVLGIANFQQQKAETADREVHSLEGKGANVPNITLSEEDQKAITKISITKPAVGDEKPTEIVLAKSGEDWTVEKPVAAKANQSNIKSLLENLDKLKGKEVISESKDSFVEWGVDDKNAIHAVFSAGDKAKLDIYFGKDGSRGQMTRVAGKDTVFAVKGYSKYLYERKASDWRDKTILKFDEKTATQVSLTNETGEFEFKKDGDTWSGKLKGRDIKEFESNKVDDLLRAYKGLNAVDFADGKTASDVGLLEPIATLTIQVADQNHSLQFGANSEGSNRWVKLVGGDVIYSVSSWAGDWGTADESKFQTKKEDDKAADKTTDKPAAIKPAAAKPAAAKPAAAKPAAATP